MIGLIMCTKECNLRCRYCFEEENFKSIILPSRDRINQSFRAAMPMLKDFCRQLIEYNRSNGHSWFQFAHVPYLLWKQARLVLTQSHQ